MQGMNYNVDIVMCIDCTGSMGSILDTVKSKALKFYPDLTEALNKKDKSVDGLRIKVIAFRDLYVDGDQSVITSDFFQIPDGQEDFSEFVSHLNPDGGGDEPENGLEALAMAINSNWNKEGSKRREIIIMWTDASAHKLEKRTEDFSQISSSLPKTFDELTDWWEGQEKMSASARRLIVFAPDAYPWTDIANHWEMTVHYPSKAGKGLEDIDYSVILDAIVNSV